MALNVLSLSRAQIFFTNEFRYTSQISYQQNSMKLLSKEARKSIHVFTKQSKMWALLSHAAHVLEYMNSGIHFEV